MAKEALISESEKVTEHIQKLDIQIRDAVETLRQIILNVDKRIGERIKWNNPSFFYNGEMQAFDPKEYKREIVVFNLHKNRMMLVFPSGAKVNDTTGFLQGDYIDGRRLAIFEDIKDINEKDKRLRSVIKQWLKLVDK